MTDERSLHDLTKPIYRAVMISMAFTGTAAKKWNPETGQLEDGVFFSHDDYDDAMAAIQELVRRANEPKTHPLIDTEPPSEATFDEFRRLHGVE